ncbi:MAG: Hsp70 family protein [Eubacteriales bacterium]
MVIGIDLGTTYSLASFFDGKSPQLIPNSKGAVMTPSTVHLGAEKEIVVGDWDKESSPLGTFQYFKEFMGTDQVFSQGEETFSPIQLSAFILKQLKLDAERYLGESVSEAVISVPAYFNHKQRVATKKAGELAGLSTTRLVNEPSAAALAYQFGMEEATLLIFDFGGGTFDVSLVDCFENIIEILSVSGDNHLGGKDVDSLLAEYFCAVNEINYSHLTESEERQLLQDMSLLKEKIPELSQVHYRFLEKELLFDSKLVKNIYQPIFKKISQIMAQALWDSGKEMSDLDEVILVGGSSHLFGLKEYITELLGKPCLCKYHPQTVVALGMGYYVGIKSRAKAVEEWILTDVCPFTLGIATVHGDHDIVPHLSPLISRNTTLPATATKKFVTVIDGQDEIVADIIQGEHYFARDNLLLDTIVFPVPPAPAGAEGVEVSFTYDLNGILQVHIFHQNSGTSQVSAIVSSALDEKEDLREMMARLEEFRLESTLEEDKLLQEANCRYTRLSHKEQEFLRFHLGKYQEAKGSKVERLKQEKKLSVLLEIFAMWEVEFYQRQGRLFLDFLEEHLPEHFTLDDFKM